MDEVKLPRKLKGALVAVGGDLKCRPAVARGDSVIMADEIGDLASPENQDRLEDFILQQSADAIVCDHHPGYFSTMLAGDVSQERGIDLIKVQHHRAHVAAVCMEHGLHDRIVVGLAFDGTGFGDDGGAWGGEFFVGSLNQGFVRRAHFAALPLPGGDAAVRQPWRIGLALLIERGWAMDEIKGWIASRGVRMDDLDIFSKALARGTAVGRSTALGRWFDAASALLGVRIEAEFEAQPAIELQRLAESATGRAGQTWPHVVEEGDPLIIDFPDLPALARANVEQRAGLAAEFHRAAAEATVDVAVRLARESGADAVVASGGCFLNRLFDRLVSEGLNAAGLEMLKPVALPPGDQAIALGQIGLALRELTDRG